MQQSFTKSGTNPLGEAAGLRWLGEPERDGGANVAAVLSVTPRQLELVRIHQQRPSVDAAESFGRALARTHAAGALWWGCAPPGWEGPATVGRSATPLILEQENAPDSWGEFYAQFRVEVFHRRLQERGTVSAAQSRAIERVCERLRASEFDSPQPRLIRESGHQVARVHGDMWSGNVLYDGTAKGATLIDPMAHGGHAETDLAALSVFGFPHLRAVYAGYGEVSPLAEGWEERVELHQLGMIIMHADLFGGSYIEAAVELARPYA